MNRPALGIAGLALVAAIAGAAPAAAAELTVEARPGPRWIPATTTALAGDSVRWLNSSEVTHTVRSMDAGFFSGELDPGQSFAHPFDDPGSYAFVCTIHPLMAGDVNVERLILAGPRIAELGSEITLQGRAVTGIGAVTIERDTGAGFVPLVSDVPVSDGLFEASLTADQSADYRAVAGSIRSPELNVPAYPRPDLLLEKRGDEGRRLRVSALPAYPGGRVVLQLRLRQRFGWWPVDAERLDETSRAIFATRRRGHPRARVVLPAADGTILSTSNVVRIG